jgi:lycopene beta-cyclase
LSLADVVVVGGGPAALAASAACASAGLTVCRIDPDPDRTWSNTYGVWLHQLDGLELESTLAQRWSGVTVVGRREHRLDQGYGVFDNGRLQAALRDLAPDARVIVGDVVGANHDRWRSTAVLADGRFVDAVVLVDATGHQPVLVHRAERSAIAVQAAYGVVARCDPAPGDAGCVLMDWSGPAGDRDPTFLYALDLGDGWWLLEETSLARRPALSLAELERRLHRRLAAHGIALGPIRAVEEVAIPLGLPVPDLRQRAVGLGGAASMVHPATGYSVGASLRTAPALAQAIVEALDRRATPQSVSEAAWAAVWPAWRRRVRALEEYGLEALLRLDRADVQAFFDAFFDLPAEQWLSYVTGEQERGQVAATMRAVFARAPASLRADLLWGNPRPLLRAVR